MTSERPDEPSTKDLHEVPPRFAQLAMGCSNPLLRALKGLGSGEVAYLSILISYRKASST